MHIHFLLHESFEAPGAFLDWAVARGHDVTMTKAYDHQLPPKSHEGIDFLIIMGGPQSPDEDKEQFPYYHPQAEIALIQAVQAANKPIVGVCLGAQLIGVANGAAYEHSPEKEIGVFPIRLTEAGQADQFLNDFDQEMKVGHWHGDMPGLTDEAVVLATSQGCPRQIVRYADKVYAFQCHMELNQGVLPALIEAEGNLDQLSQEKRYVQDPETIMAQDYKQMNQTLYAFLDRLVADGQA